MVINEIMKVLELMILSMKGKEFSLVQVLASARLVAVVAVP